MCNDHCDHQRDVPTTHPTTHKPTTAHHHHHTHKPTTHPTTHKPTTAHHHHTHKPTTHPNTHKPTTTVPTTITVNYATGPLCYDCYDQTQPDSCSSYKACQSDEKCFLTHNDDDSKTGRRAYHSGCIKSDLCDLLKLNRQMFGDCLTCCDTDFCNNRCQLVSHTISASATLHTTHHITTPRHLTHPTTHSHHGTGRGPICYRCNKMAAPNLCNNHVTCQQDEYCSVGTTADKFHNGSVVYQASCFSKQVCDVIASMVQEYDPGHTHCHRCCDSDYCNNMCIDQKPTASVQDLTLPPATVSYDTCISHGYSYIGSLGVCFKLDTRHVTWQRAEELCAADKGSLATIRDQSQWDIILTVIKAEPTFHNRDIYIGLRRNSSNSAFYWRDGSAAQFTEWGSGQPGQSNCVYLSHHDGYKWHTVSCDTLKQFLCTK